ncbi:ORF6 [Spodoptera eridania nucleopolyhedrovirus]|uniref:ORF6 n=1 Tax=Spodoptera eridania nucleopolyhedrovirus TaxID=2315721 RepID=A0A346TPU4_9ABAC|nr:ORF6 [Spodoptera eridania nucleopolyhedrovirus]AXU41604.1 ORF6 [Spodoptera eridania nucleopolyhedrovirus]
MLNNLELKCNFDDAVIYQAGSPPLARSIIFRISHEAPYRGCTFLQYKKIGSHTRTDIQWKISNRRLLY